MLLWVPVEEAERHLQEATVTTSHKSVLSASFN
jgi:hypothetical protein